ncbi:hypothetical protein NKJ36_27280 [Mesorhizobium sp. M0142]|uniref:hypothetical protein n=1 Tax=unclassified Mesorhizobium TaxID=325217 RepID=UPI00333A8DB4
MSEMKPQQLPRRLRIDFRSTKPTYELYTSKGCNRRDLVSAGLSEQTVSRLLWNSYANKESRYTLIRPEEWFWTDRNWWKDKSPHLDAMYELAGGSFSDLLPHQQAELLNAGYLEMTGRKIKGNQWLGSHGQQLDIVRYMRERLIEDGYDMAPAYSEGLNLLVKTHCKATYGKDITFIRHEGTDSDEQRRLAKLSVGDLFDDPGRIWDANPTYYFAILNGFRKIKGTILETIRVVGKEAYSAIYHHFWIYQSYENLMCRPGLPPLVGSRNGELKFFFVTQNASFGSAVSNFVRDYALPLGLSISLIQLSPENE